jgi:hypothetical protein
MIQNFIADIITLIVLNPKVLTVASLRQINELLTV